MCACVCGVWYVCWGVGGVSVAREQPRKRENRKGNEQEKKEIMCPLQDSNLQSPACEATVLSPVLLRMCY